MKIFGKNPARSRASQPKNDRNPYHSVDIVPGLIACSLVKRVCAKRYLADEAPALPVIGCENTAECHCVYKHYADRRTELRRDSDYGLPVRGWQNERRCRSSRRATDKARSG